MTSYNDGKGQLRAEVCVSSCWCLLLAAQWSGSPARFVSGRNEDRSFEGLRLVLTH